MKILKVIISLTILLMIANISQAESQNEYFLQTISFIYGSQNCNTNDWDPVERQDGFGVRIDFGKKNWPVLIALDYISSAKKRDMVYYYRSVDSLVNVSVEGKTKELCLGLRKYFHSNNKFSNFVGTGIANIKAELNASALGSSSSDESSALGYWIDCGFLYNFSPTAHAGVDLRYSKTDVKLYNTNGEAGGFYYGIFLGLHSW